MLSLGQKGCCGVDGETNIAEGTCTGSDKLSDGAARLLAEKLEGVDAIERP